jgi:GAF domain-containing protein
MSDDLQELLARFERAIAEEAGADAPYAALQRLTEALVGVKLFTIMSVDLGAGLARRAYSSNPVAYPASGVKPIRQDAWFAVISEQRRPFIANTIEEIATVFGDHELIASLGCGSVINLPVFVAGQLLGTVNILHEPHYYTPERAARFVAHAALPAKLAMLAAERQR